MEVLWPQSGTALLSVYVYMEVGVTCIGVWIFYFSESAAHLKKNELGGLEAMQYGYNFTYSFRNN